MFRLLKINLEIINLEINLVFLFIYFFLNKPIIGPILSLLLVLINI